MAGATKLFCMETNLWSPEFLEGSILLEAGVMKDRVCKENWLRGRRKKSREAGALQKKEQSMKKPGSTEESRSLMLPKREVRSQRADKGHKRSHNSC